MIKYFLGSIHVAEVQLCFSSLFAGRSERFSKIVLEAFKFLPSSRSQFNAHKK